MPTQRAMACTPQTPALAFGEDLVRFGIKNAGAELRAQLIFRPVHDAAIRWRSNSIRTTKIRTALTGTQVSLRPRVAVL